MIILLFLLYLHPITIMFNPLEVATTLKIRPRIYEYKFVSSYGGKIV